MRVLTASSILVRSRLGCGSSAEEPSEIQTDKKERKVDRPAHGAKLRRLDGIRPHERDWDLRQVETELHPAADEEGASEEFTTLAVSHSDVKRRQSNDDDRGHEIGSIGLLPALRLLIARYRRPSSLRQGLLDLHDVLISRSVM
jgi:hypothetical protein